MGVCLPCRFNFGQDYPEVEFPQELQGLVTMANKAARAKKGDLILVLLESTPKERIQEPTELWVPAHGVIQLSARKLLAAMTACDIHAKRER